MRKLLHFCRHIWNDENNVAWAILMVIWVLFMTSAWFWDQLRPIPR
jgi:hypothetical protein